MPRGGARVGAGRKAGLRTKLMVRAVEFAEKSGATPLQFLLSVMNNGAFPVGTRLAAATAAAVYCHPRLSASLHANMPSAPGSDARERLDAMLARLSNSPASLLELPACAVNIRSVEAVTVLEPRQ
jgi:hypothetical protein